MAFNAIDPSKEKDFCIESFVAQQNAHFDKLSEENVKKVLNTLHVVKQIQVRRLMDIIQLAPKKDLPSTPLVEAVQSAVDNKTNRHITELYHVFDTEGHYPMQNTQAEIASVILGKYIQKTKESIAFKDKKRVYPYNKMA